MSRHPREAVILEQGVYRSVLSDGIAKLRHLSDGRPFLLSMVDNQWTRTVSVYGGLEDFYRSGSDVFDGASDLDDSSAFGAIIGRRHSTYLRSVFDFTYRSGDFSNLPGPIEGEIEVYSVMKNIYVDLVNPYRHVTTPYLGFGVGYAYVDAAGQRGAAPVNVSGESTYAYQALAGLSVKLRPCAHLFAEYRYFGTGDVSLDGLVNTTGNYSANNVFLGLRFGL
jgi:opacity protein-like surface antigen